MILDEKIMEPISNTSTPLDEGYYISGSRILYLDLFWIGFVIYVLSYVIKGNVHVPLRAGEMLQFIGLVMLLPTVILLLRFKFQSTYLAIVFSFFMIWSLYVIKNGFKYDYTSIKYLLLSADYGALFYLVPFVIFLPLDFTFLKKLFNVIIILAVFYVIYTVLFIKPLLNRSSETQDVIEHLVRNLSMTAGFLLLTYKYHSSKRNFIAFSVMILSLLFTIYRARRGLSTTLICILIPAYFIYLFSTKKKIAVIYCSVLFLILGIFYASNLYNVTNNKLFGFMAERGTEDTRSLVEDYFYEDMKEKDWIFGKGVYGSYYCPDIEEDQESDYRTLIETGYLQIILKGGLIRLTLFLLIALPAPFLGLFFSKNMLSKAAAIWIIVALISLYPATVESFSLQYLIVWISIGICYSKQIRKLPDYRIKEYFLEMA